MGGPRFSGTIAGLDEKTEAQGGKGGDSGQEGISDGPRGYQNLGAASQLGALLSLSTATPRTDPDCSTWVSAPMTVS